MPPVHRMSSAPSSAILAIAAVISSASSPQTACAASSQPYSASLSTSTGVNASWISPFFTSLPVVTTPKGRGWKGRSCKSGSGPAALRARSIFAFSITSGMTRVPHSLSPFLTGKPPARVAIIMSPSALTARRRSVSTSSRPSASAVSSILPSLGAEARMCGP